MPSKENHKKFVKEAPYKHWYLIYENEELCGSFYIKRDNSVGLNLVRQRTLILEKQFALSNQVSYLKRVYHLKFLHIFI